MSVRLIALSIALVFAVACGGAQPRTLTLEEAKQIALERNLNVVQARTMLNHRRERCSGCVRALSPEPECERVMDPHADGRTDLYAGCRDPRLECQADHGELLCRPECRADALRRVRTRSEREPGQCNLGLPRNIRSSARGSRSSSRWRARISTCCAWSSSFASARRI